VTVGEIESCLKRQGVTLALGDILLLRFGWIHWYEELDSDTRHRLAATDLFPTPGLANSEETVAWIWDQGLSAVAADNPALEVQPFDETQANGFLHYRLIPLLGFAIGELFALDALADDCETDGIYEGLLASAPLNKLGGCGSPANALAVK
jgi:Putative cyclase